MGCLNASFTLVVELFEAKYRRLASMGLMIAFAIGEAFVGICAIFLHEWRNFHLFTSLPLFLMIPISWAASESPRWLNRKEKYKELYALFTSIAKLNRSRVPPDLEVQLQNSITQKVDASLSDLSQLPIEVGIETNPDKNRKATPNVKPSQLILDPALKIYTIVMFSNWSLVTLGMCPSQIIWASREI